MTFEEVLNEAIAMLKRQGRVSYRALKRQFDLDDEYLDDVTAEIIEVHQVATDHEGTTLIWSSLSDGCSRRDWRQLGVPV